MKITLKSNIYLNRLDDKEIKKLLFNNVILPIGRAAKNKVDNAFSGRGMGVDIYGEPYEPLNQNYMDWKSKQGGADRTMVMFGGLKGSIKLKTNQDKNTVKVFSNIRKNHGRKHLTGGGGLEEVVKIRKWFFTEEEAPILHLDDRLLKDDFDKAFISLEQKLRSRLKGKMRIIKSIDNIKVK